MESSGNVPQRQKLTELEQVAQLYFAEVARECAARLQKNVQARVSSCVGIEIPEELASSLKTAFLHAARNAVDHGIEMQAKRLAAGKPGAGTLILRAELEQGSLHLSIRDDGAGPDLEAIRRKALHTRLVSPEEASQASEARLLQILFESEFSTREQANEWSGRGVGLSAVASEIGKQGGSVLARRPSSLGEDGGGFELVIQIPLRAVGLKVVPARIGGTWLAFPARDVQVTPRERVQVGTEGSEGAPADAQREARTLAGALLENPGPGSPVYIKFIEKLDFEVAVDEVGTPEPYVFQPLDPIWKKTGSRALKAWMGALAGRVMASQYRSELMVLADPASLAAVLGRGG